MTTDTDWLTDLNILDKDDRDATAEFYTSLGLTPDGFPLGFAEFEVDTEMDNPDGLAATVVDPPRSLRVPAAQVSVTDQLTAVLGTFAIGESVPQTEVLDVLNAIGLTFSRDTLHKARKRAGIMTRRVYEGRNGYWLWTRLALD